MHLVRKAEEELKKNPKENVLTYEQFKEKHLASISVNPEKAAKIASYLQKTPEWKSERVDRVTVSNYGTAIGHNPYSTPNALLKNMLWEISNFNSAACQYGNDNEDVVRQIVFNYMKKKYNLTDEDIKIEVPNLMVSPQFPFTGYSPDGIVTLFKESDVSSMQLRTSSNSSSTASTPNTTTSLTLDEHCDPRRLDPFRQTGELPLTKPRGPTPTCFDTNKHEDKKWIEEPILEYFIDNDTLEEVPYEQIPLELFTWEKPKRKPRNTNNNNNTKTNSTSTTKTSSQNMNRSNTPALTPNFGSLNFAAPTRPTANTNHKVFTGKRKWNETFSSSSST